MMRQYQTASLLCLALMVDCFAQTVPPDASDADASQSTEMALRVLQYELIVGVELDSQLAVCVDTELHNAWMLPEKAQTELSAKAVERVRRRLEICQAGAQSQAKDLRLAAEIRIGMEAQLKAARALELSKNSARNCLNKTQTQDTYKDCMTAALPVASVQFHWPRWLALFNRRTSLVAMGAD